MSIIGYIRVSSNKQTLEHQRYEIKQFARKNNLIITRWVEETISSRKPLHKRKLGLLLEELQTGDILISCEISRLGRSLLEVTPKYIVDMFGTFDYDPATTEEQAKALGIPNYSTIYTDGLRQDWCEYKRIWINPPFYLKFPFLEKAVYTYQKVHNDIYFLGPVSMLTAKKFHEIIEGIGIKLYIPNGRIKFRGIYQEREETPPFGCVIFKLQSQNEIKFFNIVVPGQHSILNETDL